MTQEDGRSSLSDQETASPLTQPLEGGLTDPTSGCQEAKKGIDQLGAMNQQMTQAGMYMNQQNHIKGAETEGEEE